MTRDELIEKLTNATEDGTTEVFIIDSANVVYEIVGIKGEQMTNDDAKLYPTSWRMARALR